MNNFINVRIKPYHAHKEKNDIKHNIRSCNLQSQIDNPEYENVFINYQDEDPLTVHRKWREEHNQKYKKRRKENLTNSNSTLLNGVITFSESIKHDMGTKYSKSEWEKTCQEAIEEIAAHLDSEIMYITFHYDEKTPHAQYHLKNFDEEGRSIFYKHRKAEQLSILQDIGYKHLSKLGMERGQSKEITNANHQTTQQYYKNAYKEAINKLKTVRKEITDLDLEKEKKKEIYAEISKMQKELRSYKEELSIFDKILNQDKLTDNEKEILKVLAPTIIDLIDKKDIKHKQAISNKISKLMK